MALIETTQKELGFQAPDFNLLNTARGGKESILNYRGEVATVVMFICNHCPYVIHVQEELIKLANDFLSKGVGFIAISSNNVEKYPQDGPVLMKALADEMNFPFPYFFDESQDAARAYDAVCTPDFSVFDADLKCVYRGRLDDSTPGNGKPVSGSDLRSVLVALEAGDEVPQEQLPSMGCSIKWK